VAHTGWHWMAERGDRLSQYRFQWPVINDALLAGVLRWMLVLLIATAISWRVFAALRQRAEGRSQRKAAKADA